MIRTAALLAMGVLAVTLATPALAVPMNFTATLTVTVGPFLSTTATVTTTSTASGVGSSSSAGGPATLPGGVFSVGAAVSVSPPYLNLIEGFAICGQGLPGGTSFFPSTDLCAPNPNGTNGTLTFNGSSGTSALLASLYITGSTNAMTGSAISVAALPLSAVGVGGTSSFDAFAGIVLGTLTGNAWTVGSVTQSGVLNGVTTVLTGSGFDARGALGEGTLKLVTGGDIFASNVPGNEFSTPVLGVLTIDFSTIPEPGTALLCGAGVLALCMAGRRRMAK